MSTRVNLPLLDAVGVASPCSADWNAMAGDAVTRRCESCRLNVYNISEMTRGQAEAFLRESERAQGRVCIRLYRRADGTVMTRDCPVGLAAVRQRAIRAAARLAAVAAGVLGALAAFGRRGEAPGVDLRSVQPFATICDWVRPPAAPTLMPAQPPMMGEVVMGKRAMPTTPGSHQP